MTIEGLTSEDLDYLQRTGFQPPPFSPEARRTEAPPDLRSVVRVEGIGRIEKGRPSDEKGRPPTGGSPITRDLIVGLSNYRVPLGFLVTADPGHVALHIGTWLPSGASSQAVKGNERLLKTGLQALYPSIDITPDQPVNRYWEHGGLALGIPTAKPPDVFDGEFPLDRLLRSLTGSPWSALVLAQPVNEALIRDLRLQLINEQRSVQTATKLAGIPSPLADTYGDLLDLQLKSLADSQGTGAWRTAVYLLGDSDIYRPLASLWRGIFSGEYSLPEPVRVWDRGEAPAMATWWAMHDPADEPSPGSYHHPFQHQTLLTSSQLAAYVHFPNLETNGFAITQVPDFDTVPPPEERERTTLHLGTVVEHERVTTTAYGIPADKLIAHAFVTGVTGSGKTNTVFHLLRQVTRSDTPFLVLEPAKTEYRALLRDAELGPTLQVFTLGDETVSPFRLNPFEVPQGIPLAVHLDLLRSVFNASFGMWAPLPQVLEASLHGIYEDRGWDVTYGTNRRLDSNTAPSAAFPTLTDLVRKVEQLVPQLGYEDRVTADLRAALRTRLNSLRTGGKGRMLDVRYSLPIEILLGQPTVLELEGIGDDDDKAFMMGLVMIRLAEHRRTQGDIEGLRHLLVIEEAHRLLANTAGKITQEGEANVQGKAVETFTNLLAEIRAYGQGVVVVDQIPSKLAPDILKNTNLKVAHRIVAGDDRQTLGATMVMTRRQGVALATLPIGRAAIFTTGEDAPLLLQVPRSKGGSGTWPHHHEVREHMAQRSTNDRVAYLLPTADCDHRCLESPGACATARGLTDTPQVMRALKRAILSAIESREGLQRTWPDILATVEPRRPSWLERDSIFACFARHSAQHLADVRGARMGWTYTQAAAVGDSIDRMLTTYMEGNDPDDEAFKLRDLLLNLRGSTYGPHLACAPIWGNRPAPCLCAGPVAELVVTNGFASNWARARDADRADGGRHQIWDVCLDAAYQLIEMPEKGHPPELQARLKDTADCVALCFAQQMLEAEEWCHPGTERRALIELFNEIDHSESPPN
ncbi:ATP-binding protein [Streptomyces sp. NPDC012510]|uniref:ATP-binding protein n=1 Tax=Streptomyces sp. NPDC012510 TaxID=3364838 RepID=UPI0036E8DB1B